MEALCALAAEVHPASRARAEAIARWGRLDGVVHAAGVLDDAPLGARTPERTRAVLAPKVEGARALVEVTAGDDLDFLAFCSSVAALHGVPGQADYAAGNAFMDGLARRLERGRTRVVAIDWGPWRGVGMVLDAAYQRGFAAQGLRPFGPHAGARAFFQALDLSARQVVAVDLEAGVVREVGPGVDGLAPGDRVLALVARGGYAERVVAPAARTSIATSPGPQGAAGTSAGSRPTPGTTRRARVVLAPLVAGAATFAGSGTFAAPSVGPRWATRASSVACSKRSVG